MNFKRISLDLRPFDREIAKRLKVRLKKLPYVLIHPTLLYDGGYLPLSNTIILKEYDEETLFHELGHALHFQHNPSLLNRYISLYKESERWSLLASTRRIFFEIEKMMKKFEGKEKLIKDVLKRIDIRLENLLEKMVEYEWKINGELKDTKDFMLREGFAEWVKKKLMNCSVRSEYLKAYNIFEDIESKVGPKRTLEIAFNVSTDEELIYLKKNLYKLDFP